MIFCWVDMCYRRDRKDTYFTVNDGYQNFLVFSLMLSSLILDSNKKVTN